jgi:septal ring factor EnvC (AmiA/AmiB activator)
MPPKQDSVEIMVGRIDEKTDHLMNEATRTNDHLAKINGKIADNCTEIKRLKDKARDNRSLIISLWSIYVLTGATCLTNMLGVWGG